MQEDDDKYKVLEGNSGVYKQYIFHLSDIHINNNSYNYYEYVIIFGRIISKLSHICDRDSSVIIITGDLIDTKGVISGQVLKLLKNFLGQIMQIAPIIIMAGNRDCSPDKLDDIFIPIIEMLKMLNELDGENYKPIYYLRKSGYYRYYNLVLGYTSLLDTKFIDGEKNVHDIFGMDTEDTYKIGLYHGKVNHSNVGNFVGFDYVLLGGNSFYQKLNDQETIAYAGSLIQRGYDEVFGDQGILQWNLGKAEHTFHRIENKYGYFTVNIKNGKMVDTYIPKRSHIRFNIENTNYKTYEKIREEIRRKYLLCKLEPKLPPFKTKKK